MSTPPQERLNNEQAQQDQDQYVEFDHYEELNRLAEQRDDSLFNGTTVPTPRP